MDPPASGRPEVDGVVRCRDVKRGAVLGKDEPFWLGCPADVSVTGFDDLPIASWATPPLTTVRQPLAAMAATAFWLLTGPAAGTGVGPRHLELETTLVVRASTARAHWAAGLR